MIYGVPATVFNGEYLLLQKPWRNSLSRLLALPNIFAARARNRFGGKFFFQLSLTHWTISSPHIHSLSWLSRKPSLNSCGGSRGVNLNHCIPNLVRSVCPVLNKAPV